MSDKRSEVEQKARLDMENASAGPSQVQNAMAYQLSSSPFLKLDADCLEELFEWLSLADLLTLRQSCKRLKQVIDFFIKANYPAVKIGYGRIKITNFSELQEMDEVKMKMVEDASLLVDTITPEQMAILKRILPQLERLKIHIYQFDNFDSILKWCPNLKYLSVNRSVNETDYWFQRQFPMMEHLEITQKMTITPMKFLQVNPNIRILSIVGECLEANRNHFLESNIKIDQLKVLISIFHNQIADTIEQLHEQGFHKRLHLTICILRQADMDRIASIPGMEKFCPFPILSLRFNEAFTWPTMPYLRELSIYHFNLIPDVNFVAKKFKNVERVFFRKGRPEDIIAFIRYASKVKEIKVHNLQEGAHFQNGIIDLLALNNERKRLAGACKVTIYVEEVTFLSTKFSKVKTEFSLITLKRVDAVEWSPDFFPNINF